MLRASLAVACLAFLAIAPAATADDGLQAPDPDGKWEESGLRFSVLRSTDLAVPNPMQVALKIPLPSPSGGFAVNIDGSDIQVDLTGDGQFNTKAKEGRPVFFLVKRDDGSTFKYAVRFYRGARNAWFYETATSMRGRLGGETVTFIDADCNGTFNEVGKDAVQIGRARHAIPLGRVIALKGKLYHLKVDADGDTASVQEYAGPTGTMDMTRNFRAPSALQYAVVQNGESYFDLCERGAQTLPAGKYVLVRGRLERGRKSVEIVRGEMKEIELAADAALEPEWGPPVRIEFKARLSDDKLHIDATLRFFGQLGEEYVNFENMIMAPEIKVLSSEGYEALTGRFATG